MKIISPLNCPALYHCFLWDASTSCWLFLCKSPNCRNFTALEALHYAASGSAAEFKDPSVLSSSLQAATWRHFRLCRIICCHVKQETEKNVGGDAECQPHSLSTVPLKDYPLYDSWGDSLFLFFCACSCGRTNTLHVNTLHNCNLCFFPGDNGW